MRRQELVPTQIIEFAKCLQDWIACDVPPPIRAIFGWDFPVMIPRPGDGESDEGFEVFGGADRLRSEAG